MTFARRSAPVWPGREVVTEFRVLGPIEVFDHGGRQVALGGPHARAFLADLVLHANRTVPTDRLVEDLWGGRAPASASHALHVYASRLRASVGPDAGIERGDDGYRLSVLDDHIDAVRFERDVRDGGHALDAGRPAMAAAILRGALGAWRGDPYADAVVPATSEGEVARLEGLRLDAIEHRVDAELALGHHADLVAELEGLVRRFPHRDRLRVASMIALYRCGRQVDALAVYEEARRELADAFGIDPGPELERAFVAILAHEPWLEAPRPPAPIPAGTRAHGP